MTRSFAFPLAIGERMKVRGSGQINSFLGDPDPLPCQGEASPCMRCNAITPHSKAHTLRCRSLLAFLLWTSRSLRMRQWQMNRQRGYSKKSASIISWFAALEFQLSLRISLARQSVQEFL